MLCTVSTDESDLRNINTIKWLYYDFSFMNLSMCDVLMMRKDGKKYHFEFFFLQRKNLRYVRIPNNVRAQKSTKLG